MKETKFKQTLVQTKEGSRHCEEHSDVAIQGGFKMTEVGMIPNDWEVKSVGQLTNVLTGFPFPGNTILENGNVRLLRGVNITEGQIRHSDDIDRFYSGNIESLREYALREDDLVIGMDGSKVGKNSAIIHKNESGNLLVQRVARLRVKNSKQPISYIFYFISSNNFIAYIDSLKTNSAIPHISPADIRNYTIPLPSKIEEQQRIANVLSDVDTLIANLEKLIAKKKNIKQGAMQQLLTGKKRLPGFSSDERRKEKKGNRHCSSNHDCCDLPMREQVPVQSNLARHCERSEAIQSSYKMTELGLIPSDWEVKKLSSVCTIIMGQSPDSKYYNEKEGTPLIQGNADIENRETFVRFYTTQITKKGLKGDLILTVRAPVGSVAKATFDCCLGRGVCALRNANDFLYQYLIYIEKEWVKRSAGSTFDSIKSDELSATLVVVPSSKAEQTAIANVLSDMDTEISALETKLAKYRSLKTGMMQQLLTGKIRLV